MKKLLIIGFLLSVIGCSKPDPTVASKENFENAINEYLSKNMVYCLRNMSLMDSSGFNKKLLTHGLITKSTIAYDECPRNENNLFDCELYFAKYKEKYTAYFVTDKGKQIGFQNGEICYAIPKLVNIVRWTENNSFGHTALVEFEVEPNKFASWVNELPEIKETTSKPMLMKLNFTQSSDGWHADANWR